ncbi:hypothetical protein ACFV7R_43990 [Streptomyces sp. NPDC059866]|uniref:hypothetical protein n=1 Tax=Streptomyces sp. NPDC059866 TaxID=3346978 RepID=UPI003655EF21
MTTPWDLLVPIDPSPGEQRWFDSLREEFPFVRRWLGLNWLDQHFAAHPDLVRYAVQESGDYILQRIAKARAERDVLQGGIPYLLERYRTLQARARQQRDAPPDGQQSRRGIVRSGRRPAYRAVRRRLDPAGRVAAGPSTPTGIPVMPTAAAWPHWSTSPSAPTTSPQCSSGHCAYSPVGLQRLQLTIVRNLTPSGEGYCP